MERSVRVVCVFTRDGAGGNPLGIHDGVLDEDAMQAIAATLGYSETIFIAPATGPETDAVTPVRIFTPTYEMPFAGHPLVGATWHCADPGSTIALGCQIGTVIGRRLDSDRAGIDVAHIPSVEAALPPAGVTAAWVVRMPLAYELHRLADTDAVAHYAADDRPAHRLVFAFGDGAATDTVRARFFAGGLGVDEDPATGSAAVALAAVLRTEGRPAGSLTIHQGEEMGCPSLIELSWTATGTTVSGSVVDDGYRTVST